MFIRVVIATLVSAPAAALYLRFGANDSGDVDVVTTVLWLLTPAFVGVLLSAPGFPRARMLFLVSIACASSTLALAHFLWGRWPEHALDAPQEYTVYVAGFSGLVQWVILMAGIATVTFVLGVVGPNSTR